MHESFDAFLSYARADDEPFVKDLYKRLTEKGLRIWCDREYMPNRGETFLREIQRKIDRCDRVVAEIGPIAVRSDYVRDERDYAQLVFKAVVPILPIGERLDAIPAELVRDDYSLIPPELKSFHCPAFRADRLQEAAISELIRILHQAVIAPADALNVPPLPPNILPRRKQLERLGEALLADAFRPVTIRAHEKRTAVLHGMAGTGKTATLGRRGKVVAG